VNILLVNPPIPYKFKIGEYCDEDAFSSVKKRVLVGPPLGLNVLAGVVPKENVVILDQKAEYDMNPNYNHEEDIIKYINEMKPEIVGFTCLAAQYNGTVKLLDLVKKVDSNILTMVGGIHPSSIPKDFIGSSADIISIGLGKHSFYNIVQELKKNGKNADFSKIPGLALNRGGSLYFTKPLEDFSYDEFKKTYLMDEVIPNRELTDRYDYKITKANKTLHYLSTSEGCTHKCNFCYLWKMSNGHYYHRSVDAIIDELKNMQRYEFIRFCDANTFGDIKRIKSMFERIIDEGLNQGHIFMGDVRTDTVVNHPELIELAVKAGLRVTVCGLESTSDEELEKYGKNSSVEMTKEGLRILNNQGIFVNGNYIIRPDYEEKDFERIAKFVEENPIYNSAYTILTPFPGTEQWDELQSEIVIRDYDYYNLTNSVLRTKLPEKEFYRNVAELYKTSGKSAMSYFEKYGCKVSDELMAMK